MKYGELLISYMFHVAGVYSCCKFFIALCGVVLSMLCCIVMPCIGVSALCCISVVLRCLYCSLKDWAIICIDVLFLSLTEFVLRYKIF